MPKKPTQPLQTSFVHFLGPDGVAYRALFIIDKDRVGDMSLLGVFKHHLYN